MADNDIPCLSYSYLQSVKYAWCDAGGGSGCNWQTQTVSETGGYDLSLALDTINNPHISYYKDNELNYAFLDHLCEGNFDYDSDVDGTDASVFKSDFGRSGFKNPCPPWTTDPWCTYP